MTNKRIISRKIEILTGLFLILSVVALLIAFILNFSYSIPNASFEEDMVFLKENISGQKMSAYAWIIAGASQLLLIPFYLVLFYRFQKGMHIASSFLLLVMAWTFYSMGLTELKIAGSTALSMSDPEAFNQVKMSIILPGIKKITLLQQIGITAFGTFATILTVSRFKNVKFPVFGSTLAFMAGPVIIVFTWLNPDHIILTSALAVAWTGLLIIGARLVNKGLILRDE